MSPFSLRKRIQETSKGENRLILSLRRSLSNDFQLLFSPFACDGRPAEPARLLAAAGAGPSQHSTGYFTRSPNEDILEAASVAAGQRERLNLQLPKGFMSVPAPYNGFAAAPRGEKNRTF